MVFAFLAARRKTGRQRKRMTGRQRKWMTGRQRKWMQCSKLMKLWKKQKNRRGRGGWRNKHNKFLMMKKYCRGGGGHGGNHPGAGGDGGNNDPGTGGAGMGIAA